MKKTIIIGGVIIIITSFCLFMNRKSVSAVTITCEGDRSKICAKVGDFNVHGDKATVTNEEDLPDDGR